MPTDPNTPLSEAEIITVCGQHLHVAVRPGDDTYPPLLLMNGIGLGLEVLDAFVNSFDPRVTVIRFDVPGTGGSPTPPFPLGMAAHAWLVARMLDRLGYRVVDVMGLSWGGVLAQQFASQYRWRCRRLVLVSTGTGGLMVPGRPDSLLKMLSLPRYTGDPAVLQRMAGETFGGSIDAHPAAVDQVAAALPGPGGVLGAYYQVLGLALTGWTSLPWLPVLCQPTLILAGDEDRIVPAVNARILHGLIPHSRVHIFHDGHLGLMTQAPELGEVIAAFLRDETS